MPPVGTHLPTAACNRFRQPSVKARSTKVAIHASEEPAVAPVRVCRVERNALQAGSGHTGQDWPWGSPAERQEPSQPFSSSTRRSSDTHAWTDYVNPGHVSERLAMTPLDDFAEGQPVG